LHVDAEGTEIPLTTVTYDKGFEICSDTAFEVQEDGFYLISYDVYLSFSACLSAAVCCNGDAIPTTVIPPTTANLYTNSTVVKLERCDILTLKLFNADATVHFLPGNSAGLNVVKIA